MSMSKKDFIALADAFRSLPQDAATWDRTEVLVRLRDFCTAQNGAFKPDRWIDYLLGKCGPNGGAIKK